MHLSNTILLAALPLVLSLPLDLESRQLNIDQLATLTTIICNAAQTAALDLRCPELASGAITAQVLNSLEDICNALPPANLPVACAEVHSLTSSIAAVIAASMNKFGGGSLEGMFARGVAQVKARVADEALIELGNDKRGILIAPPTTGFGLLGSNIPGLDTLWPIFEPMVSSVLGLAGTPSIPEVTQPLGGSGMGLNGVLARGEKEG